MNHPTLALLAAAALASPALAQEFRSSSTDKFAWGENIGYINFDSAGDPARSQSMRIFADHLTGYLWAENVGWINLGNGGGPYANTNGTNFGVNRNPSTNQLSGFAWGENIGWINFNGGALASPANPARIDLANRRLNGFAWGENVGWINLDNPTKFVAIFCVADIDQSGGVDLVDFFEFFNCFDAEQPCADIDGLPGVDLGDFFAFFGQYDVGC